MSVSFNGSLDYNQWQTLVNQQQNQYNVNDQMDTRSISQLEGTIENDQFVSSSGETCTDGKDDGKIGFFSAIGNAIKGVGKTIVNGVKGMFTDKDGKFSLGKTLLSIGTAALCIACPAVGVAACVVGGTMGAVQVGKGIYNAATAKTDAEAKEAWQNIGGGAFTVGMSVVGAKAGVKGMKGAAGKTEAGSALEALKTQGTKFSAKTAGQYAKAFVKDGYRSGKYNLGQIKDTGNAILTQNKMNYAEKKLGSLEAGTEQYKKYETMFDNAADKYYNIDGNARNTALEIKNSFTNKTKNAENILRHPIETIKNSNTAETALETIRHPIKSMRSIPSNLSKGAQNVFKELQRTDTSYAQLVEKYGYENVAEVLKLVGGYEIATDNI